MYWNYRVVQYGEGEDIYLEVHEIHYNDDNTISSMSVDPISPFGETIIELGWDIEKILEALDKPILRYSKIDFVRERES